MSINYNKYDFSPNIKFWEDFAEDKGFCVEDDIVWYYAREYENIPSFENIYQSLLLDFVSTYIKSEFDLECEIYINSRDTKCSIKFEFGYQNFDKDVLEELLELV